jgi:hypothetical protein
MFLETTLWKWICGGDMPWVVGHDSLVKRWQNVKSRVQCPIARVLCNIMAKVGPYNISHV